MATVYITEFRDVGRAGDIQAPEQPPYAEQTVAIGGASAQSSAFSTATRLIRVHADAICSIAIGENPTATATKARFAAGQTEYFTVLPGHKIAVITNT
jgi:hypothetical protein